MSHVATPRCQAKEMCSNSTGTVSWVRQCRKKAVGRTKRCTLHLVHEQSRELEQLRRSWWRKAWLWLTT